MNRVAAKISGPDTMLSTPRRPFTTNLDERLAVPSKNSSATPRQQSTCKHCRKVFLALPSKPRVFCGIACKAEWQRTQKPVSREWLYQKYIVEGMDCTAISKIVGRNSKRVWDWLRDLGIPTRPRGHGHEANPQFAFWLHGTPNPMLGKKLTVECRKRLSEIAKADGRLPFDPAVGPPLKGKRGAQVPTWRGGVTPERQSFYSTPEWKAAVIAVWKRDRGVCQRCGKSNAGKQRFAFDIHHIVPFECKQLRADPDNLVLLCEQCHYWVHSNENADRVFIKEVQGATEA